MMCISVDFFGFIWFEICSTSWIYRFWSNLGSLSSYYFEYFSYPILFLFFPDSNDMNIKSFVVFPQVLRLFAFFSIASVCGQAPQDGFSLALCISPAWPVDIHLHPTHTTDLDTCPRPQLMTVLALGQNSTLLSSYQRVGEDWAPLVVSLVTDEPTWYHFPL